MSERLYSLLTDSLISFQFCFMISIKKHQTFPALLVKMISQRLEKPYNPTINHHDNSIIKRRIFQMLVLNVSFQKVIHVMLITLVINQKLSFLRGYFYGMVDKLSKVEKYYILWIFVINGYLFSQLNILLLPDIHVK